MRYMAYTACKQKIRSSHKTSPKSHNEKKPHKKLRHRWEDIIKIYSHKFSRLAK